MKMRLITVLILMLCFACLMTASGQQKEKNKDFYAQTQSSYTLQFSIIFDRSMPDLSASNGGNERSEYIYQGKTFGAGKGFGGSIVSKIRIGKTGPFRFNQEVAFNRILSFPYDDIRSVNDVGEANYNVFTGALGMEYNFSPSKNLRAYLGAEINSSLINGDLKIWFQRIGHPVSDSNASYSVSNSFRMGYGLNIGTEYIINSSFGFNIGIKYSNLNAFIKNSEGLNEDPEFQLRDDDNPSLIFAGRKNFSFFSIAGGVNLYFGAKTVK